MPAGCAADVVRVVAYIDGVFASGNETAIDSVKAAFGLPGLRNDDFVSVSTLSRFYFL